MVKTQSCLSDLFIRHASVHSLNIYWVCFICPELRELLCLSEMIISKKWSGREASTWEFVSIWLGKLRTWMVYFLRAETSCGASLIKVNAHFAHWKISSVIQEEMSSELWKWCTKELNSFCLGYKLFCYCLFVSYRWSLSSWVHGPFIIIGTCQALLFFLFMFPFYFTMVPFPFSP